jgi:hypothetical protein
VLTANPFRLAKTINSDSAKPNIQKKAHGKKVAHHKAVNRNLKKIQSLGRSWETIAG